MVENCGGGVEILEVALICFFFILVKGEKPALIIVYTVGHMLVSLVSVGKLLDKSKEIQKVKLPDFLCIIIVGFYFLPRDLVALPLHQQV